MRIFKGKQMQVTKINNNINFKGPLDGIATQILRTCDMNEMVNAVGLDIGAMVVPRAYYDTKHRNEYAGSETFIREISGTFINCLSAGIFARLISKVASKNIEKDVLINPKSWYSADSLETLNEAWEKTGNLKGYIETAFDNMYGQDGHNTKRFKDINWSNIEWIDEKKWEKIKWDNSEYKNLADNLKTKEGFVNTFERIVNDKNISTQDKDRALKIFETRITNALGVQREATIEINGKKVTSKLENILRDTHDMAKDVFYGKNNAEIKKIINKTLKVNKVKAYGAILLSCILGLTNQHINRKITEKRTGKKGFVGDVDYVTKEKCQETKKDKFLLIKKIGASLLMAGMVFSVMGVKSLKQFGKKLEFTGPITSGNAIKTVYAANIIGRFMAADNGTELRESMTRDYLGFLNWLVFGGFAAKGVANLLDRKGKNLFNYTKEGKGLKHWLKDMSLKTHNEIAAKGKEFAKKNMWKVNVANAAGIAYSAVTLGILLPMLNAKITKKKSENKMCA